MARNSDKIEIRKIDEIIPYINNPRHNKEAVDLVAASISEFGFKNPIILDSKNVIVAGHTRFAAAKKLGLKEVPCIMADDLTEQQIKAFRLADNKVAEAATWDMDLLKIELDGITDIDMSNLGFDDISLGDETTEGHSDVSEDDVPEKPDEPNTKVGDIYQLGKHRLICGDSTDAAVIGRLMDGTKADISITSPPYGAKDSSRIRDHYVRGAKTNDSFYNKYEDDSNGWVDLIQSAYEVMAMNSIAQFINIQMLADNKRQLVKFIYDNMDQLADVIVWDKVTAPPQMQKNVLNNQYEFIFVFGNKSRTIPFGAFHGNQSNIVVQTVGNNQYADIHRAVYPVGLPAKIMEIASKAKSVLDVFGGTGTTLIACEQLNRKCYMAELDPKYCDVIIARWEKLTGKKAERIN